MKTLRLIGVTLFVALVCVNLISCNDDDNEGDVSHSELIGRWELVKTESYSIRDGEILFEGRIETFSEEFYKTFKTDGTCIWEEQGSSYTATYKYLDDKITFIFPDGDSETVINVDVTASELVMENYNKYINDYSGVVSEYSCKEYYRRVN